MPAQNPEKDGWYEGTDRQLYGALRGLRPAHDPPGPLVADVVECGRGAGHRIHPGGNVRPPAPVLESFERLLILDNCCAGDYAGDVDGLDKAVVVGEPAPELHRIAEAILFPRTPAGAAFRVAAVIGFVTAFADATTGFLAFNVVHSGSTHLAR